MRPKRYDRLAAQLVDGSGHGRQSDLVQIMQKRLESYSRGDTRPVGTKQWPHHHLRRRGLLLAPPAFEVKEIPWNDDDGASGSGWKSYSSHDHHDHSSGSGWKNWSWHDHKERESWVGDRTRQSRVLRCRGMGVGPFIRSQ